MALRKLVAGNWKMHGAVRGPRRDRGDRRRRAAISRVDVALCVPAILIERAARAVPGFAIGGQDVHHAEKGAHTGCTSAQMLLDAGARLTIVGHSERRDAQRESDAEVKAKAEAALACGLDVILCVGETLEVREQGAAISTVLAQLDGSLPERSASERAAGDRLRAGVGDRHRQGPDDRRNRRNARRDPRPSSSSDMAMAGRAMRILYGGSVKASNAGEIFAVDECRRRAGRRREPQGGRLHADRRSRGGADGRAERHSVHNQAWPCYECLIES